MSTNYLHKLSINTACGFERKNSSEDAHQIINKIIKSHKLLLNVISKGSTLKTYQVFLKSPKLKKIFIGCGKGIGIQSQVSALFEAFEHYASYLALQAPNKPTKLKVHENQTLEQLINEHMLPQNFIELIGGANVTMPWIELNALHKEKKPIHYPLCLLNPYYNKISYDNSSYQNISYLSTSSGHASGSCFEEALIHSLNEAIERDANSLFLYQGFIKRGPIKIIDKTTIPDYLKKHITTIENEFNDELVIIDITSNIKVPTFCVCFTKYNAPILPKGFGSSLSKTYALERALLESLQPIHLRNDNLNHVEQNTVKRLEKMPLLQKAAIGDVKSIIDEERFELENFTSIADFSNIISLTDQKDKILSLLSAAKCFAYIDELYTANNYSLVSSVLSNVSNLYLLQVGKIVFPKIEFCESRLQLMH